MSDFASLKLAEPLTAALRQLGYTTPTPIQLQAIPSVLQGRDLMGIAQTGTGKTAAFALPLLDHLCRNDAPPPKRGARVLILAPTRELASQIAVSVRDYGRNMECLSVTTVFGGVSLQRQIKRVTSGNSIIVATPGRLIDLLDRKCLTLKDMEILVLDEADQMMDMGFIHALKKIVPLLPEKRQTLFFSATMVPKIKKLAAQFLTDPVSISVTPANSTADKVEQRVTFVNKSEKPSLLALELLKPDMASALVFTRTKHGADRLVKRLRNIGLDSQAIHGNKSQAQRQRSLAAFREGQINILIATDVAARGIDIEGITHVFNYEIPNVPEQYVHRIGRTARAKRSGIAHAFVDKEEQAYLKDIQKLLKTTIPVVDLPEDFADQAKALTERTPLPMPEKIANEPRQGRGKSRRHRGRASKAGAKKDGSKQDHTRKEGVQDKANAENKKAHVKSQPRSPSQAKLQAKSQSNPQSNPKGKSGSAKASEKRSWKTPQKPRGRVTPPDGSRPDNNKSDNNRPDNNRPDNNRSDNTRSADPAQRKPHSRKGDSKSSNKKPQGSNRDAHAGKKGGKSWELKRKPRKPNKNKNKHSKSR